MVERVRKRRWGRVVWAMLLLAMVVVAVAGILNREWIYDFYRGQTYQPSAEMVRIRGDLQLTERGEFLFNAAQPELNESAEFNSHCRDGVSETAVLGCYTGGRIYVYNITDAELAGIRELTTAHELLHARWARMSEQERVALVEPLTHVFEDNEGILAEEIDAYDVSEKQEELYVRAGTEVAQLPEALEQHYAEIFRDQDAVVAYYDSYIGVFRQLAAEMEGLRAEMDAINEEIKTKTQSYEQRVGQLNADVVSFNSCAKTRGCFATEEDFYDRRAELMSEQELLNVLYEEINTLVAEYNTKVNAYNEDVGHSEQLNTIINSTSKPNEIE